MSILVKSLVVGITLDLSEENIQVLFEIANMVGRSSFPISELYLFWIDCDDLKKAICADACVRELGKYLPIPVTSITRPARQALIEKLISLFRNMAASEIDRLNEDELLSKLSQTTKVIDLLFSPRSSQQGMTVLEACYAEIEFYDDKISLDVFSSTVANFSNRNRRFGGVSTTKAAE